MELVFKKKIPNIFSIKEVKYLEDYKLRIVFSNGHINIVNFEPFIKKARNQMIIKYRDINLFKSFYIEEGNLIWNDYEMSFSLEDLYQRKIM
ncbi:MAG: DUF2442 domain-containing protein [Bacteroidia bacterium]|nr:DUF2442 domain-containing protein [Bacteroidia bacterium]